MNLEEAIKEANCLKSELDAYSISFKSSDGESVEPNCSEEDTINMLKAFLSEFAKHEETKKWLKNRIKKEDRLAKETDNAVARNCFSNSALAYETVLTQLEGSRNSMRPITKSSNKQNKARK